MTGFQFVLATCALVTTLCILLVAQSSITAIGAITATVNALPGEVQATRQDLIAQIDAVRVQTLAEIGEMNVQLDLARRDLNANTQQLTVMLDKRLDESSGMLDAQLSDYRATFAAENSKYIERFDTALQQTGEVQARWLEREPLVYSRFLATTGEAMRTLDAMRKVSETAAEAAPRVAKSTEEIAAASAEATRNTAALMGNLNTLTKPKPWWSKAFGVITALKVLLP